MGEEGGFAARDGGPLPVVLREAGGVVAVCKPAGLATQAPPGLPSVEAWLRGRLATGAYVGVPHRLDRAVSGVLLLAVTPRAARQLSRQFERRRIGKAYVALLAGAGVERLLAAGVDEWHDSIAKVEGEPRARVADPAEPGAREAITRVRIASRSTAGRLFVVLEPLTGRMHQLRVQAAARGASIVGDVVYGSRDDDGFVGAADTDPRSRPVALHAWRITYADPDSGSPVTVEAPLPAWCPCEPVPTGGS